MLQSELCWPGGQSENAAAYKEFFQRKSGSKLLLSNSAKLTKSRCVTHHDTPKRPNWARSGQAVIVHLGRLCHYAFEIPPLVLLVHAALESATATEGYSQLAATPPVLRHNCTEVLKKITHKIVN